MMENAWDDCDNTVTKECRRHGGCAWTAPTYEYSNEWIAEPCTTNIPYAASLEGERVPASDFDGTIAESRTWTLQGCCSALRRIVEAGDFERIHNHACTITKLVPIVEYSQRNWRRGGNGSI